MKKKIGTVVATVLMVVLASVMLTACGGVTGKYTCTMKLMDYMPEAGTEYGDMTISLIMELKKDDTLSISAKMDKVPEGMQEQADSMAAAFKQEGTYKIDGEKITLTVQGQDQVGTIKKGEITMVMVEAPLIFKK